MNFTRFNPKYILTVELTELCQSYFQSPIGLDIVEEFSFARIFLFIINSIATFFYCCSFAKVFNPLLDE